MHLLNITNIDYFLMTILFGVVVAVAYYFRRKNVTSGNYLVAEQYKVGKFGIFLGAMSVGLPEFIVLSSLGAYLGISFFWIIIPVYLFSVVVYEYFITKTNLFDIVTQATKSSLHSQFLLILYAAFMLLVAGAAIMVMVTLFKSLLGWEFGNSTLSLMALIAISLLIGGVISVWYNQSWIALVYLGLVVLSIILGVMNLGVANIGYNLQQVAISNKLNPDIFINPSCKPQLIWLLFVVCGILFIINPMTYLRYKKLNVTATSKKFIYRLVQLVIIVGIAFIGVMALATPSNQPQLSNGNKIITQQTRLDDGSIGYVVKAVNSNAPTQQKGLIPLLVNSQSQVSDIDTPQAAFDYASAGFVFVKNVLPYAFVSLFIIVLLFFKTISETISFATIASIRGIYAPYYNKTKEDLENIWAARVFMFMFFVIAICIGLVFYKFFDFYYVGTLLIIFAVPLLMNLIGLGVSWIIDIFVLLLISASLTCVNINGVPSLLALIPFANIWNFITVVTSTIVGFYIIVSILSKLFKVGARV